MKRFLMIAGCVCALSSPSFATTEFSKQWRNEYSPKDGDEEFYNAARKAGCYICHVKGHPDKKKARNEYGTAVFEFLKKDDFPRDYVKANPEEAKAKILEGFKKAGEAKSSDGKTFSEKIAAKELPATDMGL